MNLATFTGRKFPDNSDTGPMNRVGDWQWLVGADGSRHLVIAAPKFIPEEPFNSGVVRAHAAVPVVRGAHTPGHWGWDGDVDKPTLTPSLLWEKHWHGYFTKGVLHSC